MAVPSASTAPSIAAPATNGTEPYLLFAAPVNVAIGPVEPGAVRVDVAVADTETAGAVVKIGATVNANVDSLAKLTDVNGSRVVEVALANCTLSEAGASASSCERSKGIKGFSTLKILVRSK